MKLEKAFCRKSPRCHVEVYWKHNYGIQGLSVSSSHAKVLLLSIQPDNSQTNQFLVNQFWNCQLTY